MSAILTSGSIFQINNTEIYVPFITLPINDNIKFLENVKQEFKRTSCWNEYRSEILLINVTYSYEK